MNSKSDLSDDEERLLTLFRALPSCHERSEVLQRITGDLMERFLPNYSVYDFMPDAAGIKPTGSRSDPSSMRYLIYNGIQETGEPTETLLGTADHDEGYHVSLFAYGASQIGLDQGCCFNFDEEFARKYIWVWRWEIVWAIKKEASKFAAISVSDEHAVDE